VSVSARAQAPTCSAYYRVVGARAEGIELGLCSRRGMIARAGASPCDRKGTDMRLRHLLVASALFAATGAPALAQDQNAPVSAVFAFTSGADVNATTQLTDAVKALSAYANSVKGNPCKGRFLQATFAGSEAGTYVAVIDCPSMDAFIRSGQVLNADPQFRKLNGDVVARIQAAGGKLASQSLYQEVR
jgi:hypothetical protein